MFPTRAPGAVRCGAGAPPNAPSVTLDPQLALALSWRRCCSTPLSIPLLGTSGRTGASVTGLALVAVGLTVAAVACVARWLVPALPWPAAIALGAIVAPPDAAAATAVLRQLKAPHRVFVILEGESLFNDATALLIYRLAVVAAMTGTFSGWGALPILAVGDVWAASCWAWSAPESR